VTAIQALRYDLQVHLLDSGDLEVSAEASRAVRRLMLCHKAP
jgi:hypothetical protein